MKDVLEISYRLSAWKMLFTILIAGAVAVALGYFAANNDRGISFYHIVTLGPAGATIFLWGLAAICGVFAAGFVVSIAAGATSKDYHIRVTPTELTAPKGYFVKKPFTVPLSDIRDIRMQQYQKAVSMQVKTRRGKVTINRDDIGKASFDELAGTLAARLQALSYG